MIITIYGAFTGEFGRAVAFLFTPDFSKLTPSVMNEALGQALFSMSVASAALITYGGYVAKETKLAPTAAMIGFADTGVAIFAGLMIFPIVFAVGLDAAAGPTLVFQSLPIAFHTMPAGSLIGFLFFVLIFFAALTSSISLLEAVAAWAKERFNWSRPMAAWTMGGVIFPCRCRLCVVAQYLVGSKATGFLVAVRGNQYFRYNRRLWSGRYCLPVTALLTSIFIGWKADKKLVEAETGLSGGMLATYRFLIGWLAPIAVSLILLFGLFPQLLG